MSLPDGYRAVAAGRGWGFAAPAAAGWAERVLGSGASLHDWASACPDRRQLAGRGTAWAVPAPAPGPGGASGWVVRHYCRGGAAALLLEDRYLALGTPRPVAELHASLEARRRGVPTPWVVAGALYPAGPFYRADLVTEEIPGGLDLAGAVFGDPGRTGARSEVGRGTALLAASAFVRLLGGAGVRHPDLNAKNIVLEPCAGSPRAWLVDLDGCRFTRGASGAAERAMRRRLERSLRKLGRRHGQPLGPEEWAALEGGSGTTEERR